MSAPYLLIRVEIEGYPDVRLVADTLESEHALRHWLTLGFARRDIEAALDYLDDLNRDAA